jgi:hypothetical protein
MQVLAGRVTDFCSFLPNLGALLALHLYKPFGVITNVFWRIDLNALH